ncbi:MAG: ATP-dependent DNA ligase [Candidatus Altiarchaeota archaeon]|nr:ATP-dependent DNA ligase [Candidatus Altiarchaeota archaeon]
MDYSELTEVYQKLEKTSSRLDMTSIIADFLERVPEEDLQIILLSLRGRVFPSWSEKDLGIGHKTVIKAISIVSGVPVNKVEDKIRETGDPGIAAEQLLVNKTQTTLSTEKLTINRVYENLNKLTVLTGKGSQDRKIRYITELLSFSQPIESRYLIRTILEKLRLGVGEGIVRDAIAQSFQVDPGLVEKAYSMNPDLGEVAGIAKSQGNYGLEKIRLTPGRPMKVMLAQKAGDIGEVMDKFRVVALEIKYDGARIQIHKSSSDIQLFTRRLEDVTKQFPEIAESARKNIKADSAIIEGEMVAIKSLGDRRPRPFQDLSRRIKRKYGIPEMLEKIPVEINLFDVVFYEGVDKTDEGFRERRKLLEEIITETDLFRLAEQSVTGNREEADRFYKHALDQGHEGVMAKNLDAPYQPGSRVGYMYKIKPVMETLDLVIVGATWGEGRRAHWLASYLLAALDPDTGELLTIGRMGTGLSDEQFKDMTRRLKDYTVKEEGKEVMLKPRIVVEVAYEEIQKSPTYESGYALRFPRLVRIREDKGVDDADTIARVGKIFNGGG